MHRCVLFKTVFRSRNFLCAFWSNWKLWTLTVVVVMQYTLGMNPTCMLYREINSSTILCQSSKHERLPNDIPSRLVLSAGKEKVRCTPVRQWKRSELLWTIFFHNYFKKAALDFWFRIWMFLVRKDVETESTTMLEAPTVASAAAIAKHLTTLLLDCSLQRQ